ncbi:Gfo/Idh/MocA family protein [Enterococcus olivae]
MKFALISSWHVHTKGFVKRLLAKEAECVYVWDFDEERGEEAARTYGGTFESDYRRILADEQVEAVIIEAPTTMHKELIVLAAKAKKHIFSDKALALSTADCLEIEQAVLENGVKFMLSLESLAVNTYQYALNWVKEGHAGEITTAYFRRSHGAVLLQNLPDYWFDKSQSGGGVTLDLGCHGFALLPLFCGKPKKVSCLMNEAYGSGVDERSTTIIEFESGCIGTATTAFIGPTLDNYLEIVGTQGSIQVVGNEHEHQAIFVQSNLKEEYRFKTQIPSEEISKVNPFPIEEFVDLLKDPEKQSYPQYDLETAKQLTRLIECAYESAETGKVVTY